MTLDCFKKKKPKKKPYMLEMPLIHFLSRFILYSVSRVTAAYPSYIKERQGFCLQWSQVYCSHTQRHDRHALTYFAHTITPTYKLDLQVGIMGTVLDCERELEDLGRTHAEQATQKAPDRRIKPNSLPAGKGGKHCTMYNRCIH